MERIHRVVGPIATNVHVLADERSREAIAIDAAIPSLAWIVDELAARDWTLKLIVSTHGHWDHIGDNAAVAAHTGADIAVHPLDRERLTDPRPLWAPFEIVPSVPAVELAEGGEVRFGSCGAMSGAKIAEPTIRITPIRPTQKLGLVLR
jgi:glyoxylase-like metal-dependent hydrolase (beta-lactamase superfamily II)